MTAGKCICLTFLLLALLYPGTSSAQITFMVSADGDKGYIIEGDDISASATVDMTIQYDPSKLANPKATLDGGSVTDVFDSTAGLITFTGVQGEVGASVIMRLTFDKLSEDGQGLLSVNGTIREYDGATASSRIVSTTPLFENPTATAGDDAATPEENAPRPSGPELQLVSGGSVLQMFKDFRGERGLKAYVALFTPPPQRTYSQEPAVALSDGKTQVRVTLPAFPGSGVAPDVALFDARLVHLGRGEGSDWVITALPNEGSWNARLIVKGAAKLMEIPLVTAPPVKMPKELTERTFLPELDRFASKQRGSAQGEDVTTKKFYFAYVFTANYLATAQRRAPDALASSAP
jgi:hypothetical protein